MTTRQHRVRVWRSKDPEAIIRPWRWRCECQRWKPFSWEYHRDWGTALHRAFAHLTEQR